MKSTNGFFWFASAILMLGALQLIASIELSEAAWVGEAIYIKADGSVEPEGSPIATDDYVIYRLTSNVAADNGIIVQRDNIVIDGCGCAIQGVGPQDSKGVGVNATGRSGVVIKNVEISGFRYGICLKDSSGIVLINNSINNNINGIALWSSHNNTITKNTISSNIDDGVELYHSLNNTISGNRIVSNNYGVYLHSSHNNTIVENRFEGCGLMAFDSYQNAVEYNTVNGRPLLYLEGVSNATVGDAGQVVLIKCENMKIVGLNISNATIGIELWMTNNTIISRSSLSNNVDGIALWSSHNNTIADNIITRNLCGVELWYSSGIVLINNSINNNINGIALWSSHNNTITKNTISSSESLNIYLWLSSGNIVVENSVARGRCGIWLDESSDNAFYHNNIADNAMQVYFTPGSLNSWDGGYPSGGNFWSNHRSIDEKSGSAQDKPGGDGIGDSPYPLDEVNVDRFPLMNPWPNRAVKVESSTGAGAVVFRSSPGLIVGLRAVPEESLQSVGELGAEFSYGFFAFNITGLRPGDEASVTVTLPSPLPVGLRYWAYWNDAWSQIPLGGNDGNESVTITFKDGGAGDSDGAENGVIACLGAFGRLRAQTGEATPPAEAPQPAFHIAAYAAVVAVAVAVIAVVVRRRGT
ncbi:MAG: NosD domain-containing protein [Candidatus Nezhaarchaeota archaeon]|nr:NosD domain-containing protein [Candidatus Nezhaarchaeota archaeon]